MPRRSQAGGSCLVGGLPYFLLSRPQQALLFDFVIEQERGQCKPGMSLYWFHTETGFTKSA